MQRKWAAECFTVALTGWKWEAVQLGAETSGWSCPFSQGVSPSSVTRVALDAECTISTFQFKLIRPPSLLCLLVNMSRQNSPPWNRSWRVIQKQHTTKFRLNVNTDHHNHHLQLVQVGTKFKDNKDSPLCLHRLICLPLLSCFNAECCNFQHYLCHWIHFKKRDYLYIFILCSHLLLICKQILFTNIAQLYSLSPYCQSTLTEHHFEQIIKV